jgi:hypothetical protein
MRRTPSMAVSPEKPSCVRVRVRARACVRARMPMDTFAGVGINICMDGSLCSPPLLFVPLSSLAPLSLSHFSLCSID